MMLAGRTPHARRSTTKIRLPRPTRPDRAIAPVPGMAWIANGPGNRPHPAPAENRCHRTGRRDDREPHDTASLQGPRPTESRRRRPSDAPIPHPLPAARKTGSRPSSRSCPWRLERLAPVRAPGHNPPRGRSCCGHCRGGHPAHPVGDAVRPASRPDLGVDLRGVLPPGAHRRIRSRPTGILRARRHPLRLCPLPAAWADQAKRPPLSGEGVGPAAPPSPAGRCRPTPPVPRVA